MPKKLLLDLFRAYYGARKNKRNTLEAIRFEMNLEREIFALYEEIANRTYEVSPSTCFIVNKPVKREIFAGAFRDRVVHHLIHGYLDPLCERIFINDSYSCRKGKGTSYGIGRVDHFIRSCSRNYSKDCFVLKTDIRGYFMSIDKAVLYGEIARIVARYRDMIDFDPDLLLWLAGKVVFNDPTENYLLKGKRSDWVGLPKSKSLFFAKKGTGLPIGNLTSQLFANIYLDGFDHFVTHVLGCRWYARYVDDMVIVHDDREHLKRAVPAMRGYLSALALRLHPRKVYLQHCARGIGFLGAFIKPHRIYAGKRIKGNFHRSIGCWNRLIGLGRQSGMLDACQAEKLVLSLNSYLGNLLHYSTYRLRRESLGRLSPHFRKYAVWGSPYRKVSKI